MKTWIILDLVAIGGLLLAWFVWRLRNRRIANAAARRTAVVPVAAEAPTGAGANLVDGVPGETSDVDDVDLAESSEAAAEEPVGDAGAPGESPEEVDHAPAAQDQLQVIVDVAHGRGEELMSKLRPILGIADPSETADDGRRDRDGGATTATGVELQRAADLTGPLGADRLVFQTDDAPGLLTNVLTALCDCGYSIEMVVHHEVILHDVDAGAARICLAHPGGHGEVEGGVPPNALSESPMIV